MSDDGWLYKDEFWWNVTFIYHCDSSHHGSVCLVGDFNGWTVDRHPMSPSSEGYSITLSLSEGYYDYKFLVNGCWLSDEHNPHRGGTHDNSVMFVHMDPNVYSLRPQQPPYREYSRPGPQDPFNVHCPVIPPDIAVYGVLQRQIYVYLPPSYHMETSRHYPVVYCNDGQNMFSTPEAAGGPYGGGWFIEARCDHYWSQGLLPEFIIVAVPNSDFVCIGNRAKEYCTADFHDTRQDPYIRYLTEVVKKEIDITYRTLSTPEHSVTLGASMGGLCAFVSAVTRPSVFGAAVCMSPSFWYVDQHNKSAYDLVRSLNSVPCNKLYLDSGDGLGDNSYETKLMADTLSKCKNWRVSYHMERCAANVPNGVTHCEHVWAGRLLGALKYALTD